jgi:hypothetical protein
LIVNEFCKNCIYSKLRTRERGNLETSPLARTKSLKKRPKLISKLLKAPTHSSRKKVVLFFSISDCLPITCKSGKALKSPNIHFNSLFIQGMDSS